MICDSLFVGIDVSKNKHDVGIINEAKKLVAKKLTIENSRAGFQLLANTIKNRMQTFQTKRCYIGMEATGDYWKNLYYFLKKQSMAFSVTVINPVQTKAYAKTELRRAKTDMVNAIDIAKFMVEKKPSASVDRPAIFDNIKDLDRQIYSLKKYQTISINRLRIELEKTAPEIEKAIRNFKGAQILALLENFPTAQDINAASYEQLQSIRYGKHQWLLPVNFIKKMKAQAKNSIAYKQNPGAGLVVQSLVRLLKQSQLEVQQLKNQIMQLYQNVKEQDSVLASIPGISKETAVVIEAYIGDVHRFSNSKKFVAYFGMNPTISESGKSKRKSFLQKKGNPIIRHKLFMAIICIIGKQIDPFFTYYQRLVDSGKVKLVAICATMRKLLTVIYAMLKNNETFKN